MSPELSLPDLMARLRQGDPEAARQLFDRFAHRLIVWKMGGGSRIGVDSHYRR